MASRTATRPRTGRLPRLQTAQFSRLATNASCPVLSSRQKMEGKKTMNPMTGLELIQALFEGRIPDASISATMGMRPLEVASGRVAMEATPDERHLNPMGGVHGGFAATVLDSVTGCALHTLLEAGVGFGTVDLAVKMLRPLKVGQTYRAEGRVLHASSRIGVCEGTLADGSGKLVAHATCTCMILRPGA